MWHLRHEKLSSWDVAYAVAITIACLITYWFTIGVTERFIYKPSDVGIIWAVVATIFAFRGTRTEGLSAGTARLLATCISFALCFLYLWFFPFTPLGLAVLLFVGTLIMTLLGRRSDIGMAGVATTVVMVVAAMDPQDAWLQPLLRLVDTAVGVAIGVTCKWIASYVFYSIMGKSPL